MWEYKVIRLVHANVTKSLEKNHEYWLNFQGADGWELVGIDNHMAYFKRPLKEIGHQKMTDLMKDMESK